MSGSWKVAYADFVTAMMAFFLLMWILAQVPEDKRTAIAGYFASGGQNVGDTGMTIIDEPQNSASQSPSSISANAQASVEVTRFLAQLLRENGLEDRVRITPTEAGVLLRVQSGVMFGENQVTLDKDGYLLLNAAAVTIRHFKMNLAIRGHADSVESKEAPAGWQGMASDRDYSQWEISALRAAISTRYLVEKSNIDPGMLSSVFYGATRPIVPDSSGRPSPENRRVEFFFHRPEFASAVAR
ncbi:MAG: flagellar motor protein MotB [Deltaproteobacteria bacterium]|jgi:chemotaxis protein MotB|nr:flagellar motor protein MotB [Deltaproteobacteria bacterium]